MPNKVLQVILAGRKIRKLQRMTSNELYSFEVVTKVTR